MLRGMAQMDLKRRLKAHRMLSLTVGFLALVGWGMFAYSVGSSARAQHQLRAEGAQLKAAQDRLLAERTQQQEAWGDLSQLQAKLASARQEIAALAQRREQAKAQMAAVQQDLTALVKRLDDKQARASETRKVRVTEPASKSSPGQAKSKT
jgi:peptidoglycan hydrolase CwlO-like protein